MPSMRPSSAPGSTAVMVAACCSVSMLALVVAWLMWGCDRGLQRRREGGRWHE